MDQAIAKTQALKRMDLPVSLLHVNDLNPNKMSDQEFIAYARSQLEYKEGVLYWKVARSPIKKGDVAGGVSGGRHWIRLQYKLHSRARLVWVICKGEVPEEVDHKDQNPLNDRIENLENGTHQQNMMNVPLKSNNKSGAVGVCWHPKAQKWMAFIRLQGKQTYLGLFPDVVEASKARQTAQEKAGYSPNHGKVAA